MTRPRRPHGSVRQSQLITTFGPGSMVDMPQHAVLVGGLEQWAEGKPVAESRLQRKVERLLEHSPIKLQAPPIDPADPDQPRRWIVAYQFPDWFLARHEVGSARARPLVHREVLRSGRKYEASDGTKHGVVPVRFVQACVNGHISDIDWPGYVHQFRQPRCYRPLWLEERGTSGDIGDVHIRCECNAARSMIDATRQGLDSLGFCDGRMPWLGPHASEKCGAPAGKRRPNRLLIRTASDAYFPQVLRVISIPDRARELQDAVAVVWDDLLNVDNADILRYERKKPRIHSALEGWSDEEVLAEIRRRQTGTRPKDKTIKSVEIETLLSSEDEIGEDIPDGTDFFARRLPLDAGRPPMLKALDRVVLLHRVREVMALVGFTRFEPRSTDAEGELDIDVQRAPLARETTWVPATENRGEGFFISFDRAAIEEWIRRPAVVARGERLLAGFRRKEERHQADHVEPRSVAYVMLHSLSHLLITAVSLEAGYPASSIRERIYANDAGYGILLHTGSPDAEGTLGGLVQVGRRVAQHLMAALEAGGLCSNDPVCAQHDPESVHVERFLHGAACHGCLLIAEPSCEAWNEYLDRALVVETVEGLGAAFFRDEA